MDFRSKTITRDKDITSYVDEKVHKEYKIMINMHQITEPPNI